MAAPEGLATVAGVVALAPAAVHQGLLRHGDKLVGLESVLALDGLGGAERPVGGGFKGGWEVKEVGWEGAVLVAGRRLVMQTKV